MESNPDTPSRPSRLLLHACCGPCLIEPLEALAEEADHVTIVFANSNIHPADEYERRRDTLAAHAKRLGVEVVELEYDPESWARIVAPLRDEGPNRCSACYRLRLGEAARYGAEHGFDAIATTLTVSPYQDARAIAAEGRAVAAEAGIAYLDRDFRDRYADATRRSRDEGMYRQNYCGCVFSEAEATAERERRRESRRALARERAAQNPSDTES
ncbi:MAG: epoxyqueuosine reductase QueH [Coriobacteriia bacterium]|nr:epoxyqueuosine reductase QueH [Coriobacteriia bacterium]